MLELLIYMFENYLSTQNLPDFKSITAELGGMKNYLIASCLIRHALRQV
jgi:hypothetical protein